MITEIKFSLLVHYLPDGPRKRPSNRIGRNTGHMDLCVTIESLII